MLHDLVYKPLRARCGDAAPLVSADTASACAFAASGLLHAYPLLTVFGSASLMPVAHVCTFFLVQAALVALEGSLYPCRQDPNPSKPSSWWRRVWVLAAVTAPAPLLIRPLAQIGACPAIDVESTAAAIVTAAVACVALWRGRDQSRPSGSETAATAATQ